MSIIKAICVVAHPDDCIIFARPFIEQYSEFEWTILYLTYSSYDPRALEMTAYWQRRNVSTFNLGFVDDYRDMEHNLVSFNVAQAQIEIFNISGKYDLLLTHNSDGEYGHIHHKFVNSCVLNLDKPKVYFSSQQNSNYKCEVNKNIDLGEIPLHKDVVLQFHNVNCGYYFVTEQAKGLVYGNS